MLAHQQDPNVAPSYAEREPKAMAATRSDLHFGIIVVLEFLLIGFFGAFLGWIFGEIGGLTRDLSSSNFLNFHPFFMVFALLILSHSVMYYRVLPMEHATVKMLHGISNFIAWIFAIVAVVLVGVWKHYIPYAGLYSKHYRSLHSWIGIVTMTLALCNWCFGFGMFMWPGATAEFRARHLHLHKWAGIVTFAGFYINTLLGLFNTNPLAPWGSNAIYYADVLGIVLCVIGAGIFWVLSPNWTIYATNNVVAGSGMPVSAAHPAPTAAGYSAGTYTAGPYTAGTPAIAGPPPAAPYAVNVDPTAANPSATHSAAAAP